MNKIDLSNLKHKLVSCYDNADRMMELFEEYYSERKCSNCKNWNPSQFDLMEANGDGYIDCNKIYAESNEVININNFSCNRWESKDAN